jgi:lysophospholipase L1-like esterase
MVALARGRHGVVVVALAFVAGGCGAEGGRAGAPGAPEADSPVVPGATDGASSNPDPAPENPGDTAASGLDEASDDALPLAPSDGDDGAGASGSADGSGNDASGDDDAEAGAEEPPPLGPLRVFIAGDSTVQTYADTASTSDQAGWGQMIGALLSERVTVDNRAIGGRTARRFIDEGRLDDILDEIAAGDYLFVQFGTNDGNRTATYTIGDQTIPYFLDPATDFKTFLRQYLAGAQERGATPVLVTPPPRNSAYCTGGNGTGGHAQAMRELGEAEGVAVLDLNARSVAYLRAICPAPVPEDFFLLRADGTVDGTHFQENGARILARLVAEAAAEAQLPLFDDE